MKAFVIATLAAVLAFAGSPARAQYPERPVKFVVPYAAGGTSDFVARITAIKLGELTGKTFVVENKAGASGRIGYGTVAKIRSGRIHACRLGYVLCHAARALPQTRLGA